MNEKAKFTPPEATAGNELPPEQNLSFKDAVYLFNPEDREEAEMFLDIYERSSGLGSNVFFELFGDFSSFLKSMEKSEQVDARASNVFHLFSGSSKPVISWQESPFKSESGKLEAFFLGEFLRKLEKFENEN